MSECNQSFTELQYLDSHQQIAWQCTTMFSIVRHAGNLLFISGTKSTPIVCSLEHHRIKKWSDMTSHLVHRCFLTLVFGRPGWKLDSSGWYLFVKIWGAHRGSGFAITQKFAKNFFDIKHRRHLTLTSHYDSWRWPFMSDVLMHKYINLLSIQVLYCLLTFHLLSDA